VALQTLFLSGLAGAMGVVYFKRFRMEVDLQRPLFPEPLPPPGYALTPWDDALLERHAEVKFNSFHWELDANVFPSLSTRDGCRRLMSEITRRGGFVPEATWLLEYWPPGARQPECCGTIQGVADEQLGAIQNVGITPEHRGKSLGTLLLWHSLAGFQRAGVERVYLEVTAQNSGACRLYERLGFTQTKIVYKASEVAYAEV
jgi:ribosomal protein S18 acetylase RimI-like enzyme